MNRVPDPSPSPIRDQLLDAAYALVAESGWAKLRMTHIATAAGVPRAVVHEHFGSLDAVGQALVSREADRFLLGIVAELRKHPDDLGRSTAAGVGFALHLAASNPLLASILTSSVGEDRILVAHITTRSEQIFDSAYTLIADYVEKAWPMIPDERRRLMVDAVVRMTISHIVAPALPPEQAARDIADIAVHVAGTRGYSDSG
ncbi:TetR family transcriptional regulator [Streptomyces sp. NPDC058297]|uniref:TetR/AcrR family transcriptional regulator n=1 Tax=Streptomyces sp. NPDC058297 TaxID=3346433 RepID=UPI0036E616DE